MSKHLGFVLALGVALGFGVSKNLLANDCELAGGVCITAGPNGPNADCARTGLPYTPAYTCDGAAYCCGVSTVTPPPPPPSSYLCDASISTVDCYGHNVRETCNINAFTQGICREVTPPSGTHGPGCACTQ